MTAAALRSPLTTFGGKGHMVPFLSSLLPPHDIYVETHFGGGSLYFGKRPCAVETVNDVDGYLMTFYRVLRDPALFDRFALLCELTSYARDAYDDARRMVSEGCHDDDPVALAHAVFIAARQSFGGGGRHGQGTGWSYSPTPQNVEHDDAGRQRRAAYGTTWGYSVTDSCGTIKAASVTRYLSAVRGLPAIHQRLQGVQIENADACKVIRVYGVPGAFVYSDPPYVPETRSKGKRYAHEMTREDHHALTEALLASPALCMLSGYRDEEIHGPLEDAGWDRREVDVALNAARKREGQRRHECVWRNPAAVAAWTAARAQQPLFSDEGEGDENDGR